MHAFLSVDPRAGSSFDGRQRANSSTPSRPSNSDVASLTSSNAPDASHWWTFNLPLPIPLPLRKSSSPTAANSNQNASTSAGPTDTAMREKPRAQWLFDRVQVGKDEVTDEGHNTENAAEESIHSSKPSTRRDLRLTLPKGPFTVAQTKTPGWDTPWAPASPAPVHMRNTGQFSQFGEYTSDRNFDPDDLDPSAKRKLMRRSQRTLRGWLLHNSLVPLVSKAGLLTQQFLLIFIPLVYPSLKCILHNCNISSSNIYTTSRKAFWAYRCRWKFSYFSHYFRSINTRPCDCRNLRKYSAYFYFIFETFWHGLIAGILWKTTWTLADFG